MAKPPPKPNKESNKEHNKLLSDIERAASEATDETTRRELAHLRERLSTPEMLEMAREIAKSPKARPRDPVLEFHDPLVPTMLNAAGFVIAVAVCLFAVVDAFETPVEFVLGNPLNPWAVASIAGAFALGFAALSVVRSFSIRCDTTGMISRISGARWNRLKIGAMRWEDIRSLTERQPDKVLEVHAAEGRMLEIPMRVANYPVLKQHLDNMVRLYGELR